jgi:hypothetical protein
MNDSTNPSELPDDARARIEAVDEYLGRAIETGKPIEALSACRVMGTVIEGRTREAAQAAVDSTWSWANVGDALGVSKQAAHEKLSRKIRIAQETLDQGEHTGHQRIREHFDQAREKLNARSGKRAQQAREKVDQREQAHHDKLTKQIQAAREQVAREEQKAKAKLDGSRVGK